MKLTAKERTQAIQQYARKHGFYARTVRHMTDLRYKAVAEWLEKTKKPS